MMVRARTLSALALVVLLGAAGCVTPPTSPPRQPSATASPSVTPTSSPTPDAPLVSIVVIGVDGLSTQSAEGEEISVLPYDSDPDAAISAVTRIFGAEPAVEHFPGDQNCDAERVEYRWSAMSINVEGELSSATSFWAVSEPDAGNSGIVVQSEHGGQVGGSFVELLSNIPDPLTEPDPLTDSGDEEGERLAWLMDGLSTETDTALEREYWPGVRVHAVGDEIVEIVAPVSLWGGC